ncbi:MAG: mechanosensitive ion channel family protein [Oscillospiraceae bacterium]
MPLFLITSPGLGQSGESEVIETTITQKISQLLGGENLLGVLIRIVLILAATWLIAFIFKRIVKRVGKRADRIYFKFLYNGAIILIYVVGVISAIAQVDAFQKGINTLLAGSGIAALAIGLAAQESLSNIVSGFFISFTRTFEVGDRIHLPGKNITGIVEDITVRHTVIRTYQNSRVLIPNSVIGKEVVENSNYFDDKVSSFVDVKIAFSSDTEKAMKIIVEQVEAHPLTLDMRKPHQRDRPRTEILVRELGPGGVSLRVTVWTNSIDTNFRTCSDIRLAVKEEFVRQDITMV